MNVMLPTYLIFTLSLWLADTPHMGPKILLVYKFFPTCLASISSSLDRCHWAERARSVLVAMERWWWRRRRQYSAGRVVTVSEVVAVAAVVAVAVTVAVVIGVAAVDRMARVGGHSIVVGVVKT